MDQGTTSSVTLKVKKKFLIRIIPIIIALLFLLFLALFTALYITNENANDGAVAVEGYYEIKCTDVTVINVDKQYNPISSATYPLEEYVAGVINNEVGMFGNYEVYKQFAIAARTYYAYITQNKGSCEIENSDRLQTFTEVTAATPYGDLMKAAAKITEGQVLLDSNGNLLLTEYDAFCSIDVDENYYTIKQKNQRIPKAWVDSQSGIRQEWKEGKCTGNHGRGMSQWGSYYLATEENYTYDQLINYYLENQNVAVSSNGVLAKAVDLAIKSTIAASYKLDQPLSSYLKSKGGSLEEYNNYIRKSVEKAGVGTREGVVAAAVSSITYLYDKYDMKLPYYWGGHYPSSIGIPSNFGYNTPSKPSPSQTRYPYVSFDCSGFVNWAIENGGYIFPDTNNYTSSDRFSTCSITSSSCIGKPGDLIDSDTHVVMIVSVDEANHRYYVAESTVAGVIIQTREMHQQWSASKYTNVVSLEKFYNNKSNVNPNY